MINLKIISFPFFISKNWKPHSRGYGDLFWFLFDTLIESCLVELFTIPSSFPFHGSKACKCEAESDKSWRHHFQRKQPSKISFNLVKINVWLLKSRVLTGFGTKDMAIWILEVFKCWGPRTWCKDFFKLKYQNNCVKNVIKPSKIGTHSSMKFQLDHQRSLREYSVMFVVFLRKFHSDEIITLFPLLMNLQEKYGCT